MIYLILSVSFLYKYKNLGFLIKTIFIHINKALIIKKPKRLLFAKYHTAIFFRK